MESVIMERQRLGLTRASTKKPPPFVISFDPGKEGGAVIIGQSKNVIHQIGWIRRDRKSGEVWVGTDGTGRETSRPTMFAMLDDLLLDASPRFVTPIRSVEYVAGQKGKSGTEVLIETAGYIRAWMDCRLPPGPTVRPKSTHWRKVMLGLPASTRADACAAAALSAVSDSAMSGASHIVYWSLDASQGQFRPISEHVAEAIGQGLCAQGWHLSGIRA